MAERVLQSRFGEELAVGVAAGLRRRRPRSSRSCFTVSSTAREELASFERDLGEEQDVRRRRRPSPARGPLAAVIQPAWRPITSRMKTLVEVFAMDATSKPASRMLVATYFATEPKPGQQSVIGRSLSTVLGTCTRDDRIAQRRADLRDLEAGVGRIVAAVVEEIADVVRLEDLDQALVLARGSSRGPSACSGGAEGAARRVAQRADGRRAIPCWCRSGLRSARR